MKSEWRIKSKPTSTGAKVYRVYRLYDVQKTNHSGNQEEDFCLWDNREDAEARCQDLNAEEPGA